MDRNSIPVVHIAAIIIIMVVSFFQRSVVFSNPTSTTVDGEILNAYVPPRVILRSTMAPFSGAPNTLGAAMLLNESARTLVVNQFSATDSITVESPEIPTGVVQGSRLEDKIIQAYRFAYSLEEQLWNQSEAVGTKKAVFQFMRQGFTEVFAWNLADYYWTEPDGLLGVGAFLIVPEHTVHVLEIDKANNEASIRHRTDEWERDHWSMGEYKIVTLRLEDGVWKVESQHSDGTPPF